MALVVTEGVLPDGESLWVTDMEEDWVTVSVLLGVSGGVMVALGENEKVPLVVEREGLVVMVALDDMEDVPLVLEGDWLAVRV